MEPDDDARLAGSVASRCPEVWRLAEYVDGVLDDAERREVQSHLVRCADCRDTVAETQIILSSSSHALTAGSAASPGLRARTYAWAGGLAAAAALALAVYVARPHLFFGPRVAPSTQLAVGPRTDRPELAGLVAAMVQEPTRVVDGRLTGGFSYAPAPSADRGPRGPRARELSPDVRIAAAEIEKARQASDAAENQAAAGVAHLVQGDLDKAVDELESAVQRRPMDARYQSDLSAAYLERARSPNHADDWSRALAAAERALELAPRMPEAAFNRALALDGLHRDQAAADAWAVFRRLAESPAWQSEAEDRELQARARAAQKGR